MEGAHFVCQIITCPRLCKVTVPIASIAKLVGHTDISTTMIYSQILQEAADDAISVLED
ncbi:MAG: hypothetical protein WAT79_09710 [Saprospiraceae bacterium]